MRQESVIYLIQRRHKKILTDGMGSTTYNIHIPKYSKEIRKEKVIDLMQRQHKKILTDVMRSSYIQYTYP